MTETASTPTSTGLAALVPLARRLVWALPVWALLLGLSTLTHQPSYDTDFPGYADYITTDQFLVSHLGASIAGAALGVIGAFALVVLLAEKGAGGLAFAGLVAFTVGQVLTTAVFGVAAFVQPAIGEAFIAGDEAVAEGINQDVYGTDLFVTVGIGLLLWIFGLVQLGRAIRRSGQVSDWAGWAFVIGAPVFVAAWFSFDLLQPVAGFLLAAAAAVVASRLSARTGGASHARQTAPWKPTGASAG